MTRDASFADWLRANPAPDLQALVERHWPDYAIEAPQRRRAGAVP